MPAHLAPPRTSMHLLLFFLRDVPSGLVLFAGRVVDPTQKG